MIKIVPVGQDYTLDFDGTRWPIAMSEKDAKALLDKIMGAAAQAIFAEPKTYVGEPLDRVGLVSETGRFTAVNFTETEWMPHL